jgi:hypothetical protein
MKPKCYAFYASTLVALLLLPPIPSALAGEILYEDNFTNLDPSWGTPGERLSVKDGKLTLKPAPNTTQSILNQSNVFDDADIRVEVTMPAGDTHAPGGLIFWAKDYSNFYCLCIPELELLTQLLRTVAAPLLGRSCKPVWPSGIRLTLGKAIPVGSCLVSTWSPITASRLPTYTRVTDGIRSSQRLSSK